MVQAPAAGVPQPAPWAAQRPAGLYCGPGMAPALRLVAGRGQGRRQPPGVTSSPDEASPADRDNNAGLARELQQNRRSASCSAGNDSGDSASLAVGWDARNRSGPGNAHCPRYPGLSALRPRSADPKSPAGGAIVELKTGKGAAMSPVTLLNSQAGLLAKTARFHRTNAEASCQCAA
jgi:hypothetical protein